MRHSSSEGQSSSQIEAACGTSIDAGSGSFKVQGHGRRSSTGHSMDYDDHTEDAFTAASGRSTGACMKCTIIAKIDTRFL